jgi:hypothetical protein
MVVSQGMLPLVFKNIDMGIILEHPFFGYAIPIILELRPDRLICLEWDGIPVSFRQ